MVEHPHNSTSQFCMPVTNMFESLSMCEWISKGLQDDNILCYRTLNSSQDTDICVLVDIGRITGQITRQITGYGGQT